MAFVLKSILSDMSIAMPLSCHFHLHEVCFSIPSFSIYMCLSHKWVSCREHIVGYCFIIQSVSICLLIRAFSPLTFKVIINKYVFIAILSLSSSWFCISSLFLSFCFSFCGWMVFFCIMLEFLSFLCLCMFLIRGKPGFQVC